MARPKKQRTESSSSSSSSSYPSTFIPSELHPMILSKLPIKSVIKFKLVCKEWLRLTSEPSFKSSFNINNNPPNDPSILAKHSFATNFSCLILDKRDSVFQNWPIPATVTVNNSTIGFQLAGSFNGLVAFFQYSLTYEKLSTYFFVLYNPSTREQRTVHVPRRHCAWINTRTAFLAGICHDPAAAEYSLVLTSYDATSFLLVSFKDDHTWKTAPKLGHEVIRASTRKDFFSVVRDTRVGNVWDQQGLSIEGCPHWLLCDQPSSILQFDPRTERFETVRLPESAAAAETPCGWGTLDGRQLAVVFNMGRLRRYEVWGFKDRCWSKLFVMACNTPKDSTFTILCWRKDDFVAFMYRNILNIYDLKKKRICRTREIGFSRMMLTYIPTLVSPIHHHHH